ncbi:MAG TPA: LuxR C-terminal-related transcriptional regulator [Pyrinomonadaceae bacterium]|nr:LuxR C-terminal-related transcriptional regulator [Pyrinomonadaceae bacterium]
MLERQLAELLEGTTDAAFTVDLQGEIRTWNKAAENLFGHPASNAIGQACATLIKGRLDGRTPVCCQTCDVLECVRTGREVSNFDLEISTRTRRRVWVNVSLLVTSDDHTERRLVIHLMRDIRRRKKAEQLTNELIQVARSLVGNGEQTSELPPIVPLTSQEKKILTLLVAGKATKEVTVELQISMSTLRNHISHINQKLHTRSRTEAVLQALKRGII